MYKLSIKTNLGDIECNISEIDYEAILYKAQSLILKKSSFNDFGDLNLTLSTNYFTVKGVIKSPKINDILLQKGISLEEKKNEMIQKYGENKFKFGAYASKVLKWPLIKIVSKKVDELFTKKKGFLYQKVSDIIGKMRIAMNKNGIQTEILEMNLE